MVAMDGGGLLVALQRQLELAGALQQQAHRLVAAGLAHAVADPREQRLGPLKDLLGLLGVPQVAQGHARGPQAVADQVGGSGALGPLDADLGRLERALGVATIDVDRGLGHRDLGQQVIVAAGEAVGKRLHFV